ncbi:hypothetical protein B9J93_15815 [Vibrio sp. V17_P4S1T151]|uniref:hypothetical protein n=1 Tax=unclassified Vibrio TaxID=2614977 RepID=UPI000B8E8FCE|nr:MULTISPECIES: hypothetical protein [unclassified Vibrio]OXX43456.1 hypothetical protein B9J93_15815 [Vibrio sp. V17_P4S1T151]OXX64616.1 hypothetical protein B9J89_01670 [Vibrio sp. V15_P4S5T153]
MKKRIALAHALTESDLEFANLIGGLPNPSLGFIPSDQEFFKYGSCVLLLDPKKIDFNNNYASSIDVYSSVFPDVSFELNHSFWDQLNDRLDAALQANQVNVGEKYKTQTVIHPELLKGAISARNLLVKNPAVKLLYLKEKNILNPCKPKEIPKEKKIHFLSNESIEALINNNVLDLPDDDANKEISKLLLADVQLKMKMLSSTGGSDGNSRKNRIELRKLNAFIENSMYFDDGIPKLYVSYCDNARNDLKEHLRRTPSIDESKYISDLEEYFKNHVPRGTFEDWVSKTIEPGFGKAFFFKTSEHDVDYDKEDISHDEIYGVERELATLNNLSKEMNRKLITCDSLFSTSIVKIAASVKERLHSLEEIENYIDQLKSEEEVTEYFMSLKDELSAIIEELAAYYKFKDPNGNVSSIYNNAATEALVQSRCEVNDELRESFFVDQLPHELITRIDDLRNSLIVAPYTYFELKMSNPIRLNDFSVAIVPKNVSPSLVGVLKENGLKICGYEQGSNFDFVSVLNKQHDLLFGDGGEIQSKILDQEVQNSL